MDKQDILRRWRGAVASSLAAAAVGFAATASAQTAPAPIVPAASALLDWAEEAYPQIFPGSSRSQQAPPYVFRHYPATGNYAGVADDGVWLLGPVVGNGPAPVRIGARADFACTVYPAQCGTGSRFPDKPITLVVPFAAGGATDRLARELATALSQRLGWPITVQDVPGRDGITGATQVAGAAADGYTLMLHNTSLVITPTAYRGSSLDAASLAPVGLVAEMPMVVVARRTLPAGDWAALRTWIASQSGQARFAHSGYSALPYACLALLHPLHAESAASLQRVISID